MTRSGMKFGVLLPNLTSTFDFVSTVARSAEKYGFASVWCMDHLICEPEFYKLLGVDPPSFEILETWAVLTAVATQTKEVELGTAVSPIPRYNPAMLAKIVTTLDVISNGRTILGVGAGHYKPEFQANDFPWKRLDERIQMMHEGVEIMKKLWTRSRTTYLGKYFKVEEAPHEPKPVRKPHPPVWVGGNIPQIMSETAEIGDGWIPYHQTPQEYRDKWRKIKEMAEQAGRYPGEIEPAYFMDTSIGLDEKATIEKAKPYVEVGHDRPFEEMEQHGAYGSPDTVFGKIERFVEAGVKHFVLIMVPQEDTLECIRLYGENILPEFI